MNYFIVDLLVYNKLRMSIKCENACSDLDNCFDIDKWFNCEHYQCKRTTIILKSCIFCGNKEQIRHFPKRCQWCQGLLTKTEIEHKRNYCVANLCYLEKHLKDKIK